MEPTFRAARRAHRQVARWRKPRYDYWEVQGPNIPLFSFVLMIFRIWICSKAKYQNTSPRSYRAEWRKNEEAENYIIFHKCEVFRKNTINSDNWTGLNVWPDRDGNVTYFYTQSIKYNLTLDMRIDWNGYRIIAHLDREPAKKVAGYNYTERTRIHSRKRKFGHSLT